MRTKRASGVVVEIEDGRRVENPNQPQGWSWWTANEKGGPFLFQVQYSSVSLRRPLVAVVSMVVGPPSWPLSRVFENQWLSSIPEEANKMGNRIIWIDYESILVAVVEDLAVPAVVVCGGMS